jgi:hypothetical protein
MSRFSIARSAAKALAQRFGVAVVVIAGIAGLSRVGFHAARLALEVLPDGPPGSGIVMRAEVTTIWLPQGLFDLAKRPTDPAVFESHEELRTHLDRLGMGTTWYALTTRGRQLDGRIAEMILIRWPRESPEHLEEYRGVLASAAGRPADHPGLDLSRAKVFVFSDSLLKGDPREVVTELTTQAGRLR